MNFPLYTLVQNLPFSKKTNNSMKNSARVTNNASNNRYFFALFVCNTNFKINYESISRITKNWVLYFCFFRNIFGDKCFQ